MKTDNLSTKPVRDLSALEIAKYMECGAWVIRDILPMDWITFMREAIEEVMEPAKQLGMDLNTDNKKGRYFHSMVTWKFNSKYERFALHSPLPKIAAQAMSSKKVNFFYDQTFVKEPGTVEATPWHQDLPYWPVKGEQIVSLWIPFDYVDLESSGVQYVKGSHKWEKRYKPVPFGDPKKTGGVDEELQAFNEKMKRWGTYEHPDVPDIDANPDDYELLSWELNPGDLILHHPLTIHGAKGNTTSDLRRRAIAVRYTGDDAVYWPTGETNFLIEMEQLIGQIGLEKGEQMGGQLFPLVWSR